MRELILIEHKNVTDFQLDIICKIKEKAWRYPIDEQKNWIRKNISKNDIHVLLLVDGNYVAYLNMIRISFFINDFEFNGIGIGNVCSGIEKKGYGSGLINEVNSYLINNNHIGVLFCKEDLLTFYESNQWILLNKVKIKSFSLPINSCIMAFNFTGDIDFFEYDGSIF